MGPCQSQGSYESSPKESDSHMKSIHQGSILGLSRVGQHIASTSEDNKVGLVTLSSKGTLVGTPFFLEGHRKAVNKATGVGETLWSASRDLSVKQWNIETRSCSHTFENAHELNISSIVARSDGQYIFSGSRDYKVKAWDIAKQICTREYSCPRNIVTAMELDAKDEMLYQCSEDLMVRVWDSRAASKQPASTINDFVYFPLCISMHENGFMLATGCKGFESVGCEVKVWDIRKTSEPLANLKGHTHDVTGCKFVGDDLVSVSKDGSIFAWDLRTLHNPSCAGGADGPEGVASSTHNRSSAYKHARVKSMGKYYTCLTASPSSFASLEEEGDDESPRSTSLRTNPSRGANPSRRAHNRGAGALAVHAGAFDGSISTIALSHDPLDGAPVLAVEDVTPAYYDSSTNS